MAEIARTLWDIQVGDEVVVKDSFRWDSRYTLTTAKLVTKTAIHVQSGAIYLKKSGKISSRYSSVNDLLYVPSDTVVYKGENITAKEAAERYKNDAIISELQMKYARYIVEQGYNSLMRLDVDILKQVAELLGYEQ